MDEVVSNWYLAVLALALAVVFLLLLNHYTRGRKLDTLRQQETAFRQLANLYDRQRASLSEKEQRGHGLFVRIAAVGTLLVGITSALRPGAFSGQASPEIVSSPPPPPTHSAASFATEIARAENVIRKAPLSSERFAGAAKDVQVLYAQLAENLDLLPEVLAAMDPELIPVVKGKTTAETELQAFIPRAKTSSPPWRIVSPSSPDTLLSAYKRAADQTGVHWSDLAAIHFMQSAMGQIQVDRPRGQPLGPMQFLSTTWARYGNNGSIDSLPDSLLAAGRLLRAHKAPDDMRVALTAYNPNPHWVQCAIEYAKLMSDERTWHSFYHWGVLYRTVTGNRVLRFSVP